MVSRNFSFQGKITLANINPLPLIIITRFWNCDTLNLEAYLTLSTEQKYQTKVSKVSDESIKCQINTTSSIKQSIIVYKTTKV